MSAVFGWEHPASIHPEIARSALHNAGAVLHGQWSLDFVLWWSTPLETNVEPKDGTSMYFLSENCLRNPMFGLVP